MTLALPVRRSLIRTFVCAVLLALGGAASQARANADAADLDSLEEQAVKAAVQAAARSTVRIEVIGTAERVGNVLAGSGPTTGLIVTADGYIVTSTFNFSSKPASILVTLPGGQRTAATLVATDHSRMLALLKVKVENELPVPEAAPLDKLQVGATAIAVGRTFDPVKTNVSAGIVSAVGRIWGKAVQTDAKISPTNYGGPLVDIRGRVIGILAPLSTGQGGEASSADWYDSGIGFAVPLEHVLTVLPRLKRGDDLHAGLLGISLRGQDIYADEAAVAAVQPNSPAFHAGLKPGDKIVEIDGRPVERQVDLKRLLTGRYAGDKVALTVLRGTQRLQQQAELIAKLPPYEHPFLGMLPEREIKPSDEDNDGAGIKPLIRALRPAAGVGVRYVYDGGPLAKLGLQPGDRLVNLDGKKLDKRQDLLEALANLTPGQEVDLQWRRDDRVRKQRVTLAALPTEAPADVPEPAEVAAAKAGDSPAVGVVPIKIPEMQNECVAYVPAKYHPQAPAGLVVWLHGASEKTDDVVARWKDLADKHSLIVLIPKSTEAGKWQRSDIDFLRKAIDQVNRSYHIDRSRVAAVGQEGGGAMAAALAMTAREVVRGLALVDSGMPAGTRPAANDPVNRLAVFVSTAKRQPVQNQGQAAVRAFRGLKYPVTTRERAELSRGLTADELTEVARWVDTLDRL